MFLLMSNTENNTENTDLSFLTLQEGCPYSSFNEPLFPPLIERISIKYPGFRFNRGRTLPFPEFSNFIPGALTSCVTLTVIDDDDFEGNEMFDLLIYAIGPEFNLSINLNVTTITITDQEGNSLVKSIAYA